MSKEKEIEMQESETVEEPKNFKFFSHRACEFFPCHAVKDPESFNCLFCYCPLYALGEECGGNFQYTQNGVKDSTNCMITHSPGGYDYVTERFSKIVELIKK